MRRSSLWLLLGALSAHIGGCSCAEEAGLDGSTGPDGSVGPDGSTGFDASTGTDGGGSDAGRPLTCRGVGEELCAGACVNTQVDPANCGACGSACAAGEVCFSNGCAGSCPPGLTACAGTCVDTGSSNGHCGTCGDACPAGEGCLGGACAPAVEVGPPPARCIGGGPPIAIGGAGALCSGALSRLTFTHGLCACDDIGAPELSAELMVDAFDSTLGPYAPGGLGGDVGAVDAVQSTSRIEIFGNLETAAAAGLRVRSDVIIHEELRVAGGVRLDAVLDVGGDALVGGAFSGGAAATIDGTLHTPSCASVPGNVAAGACVSGPVAVPSPCRCHASEIVPIAAIVSYYADASHHDNDEIGLSADALASSGGPRRLDLPCGYYYLSRIDSGGATTIAVHGRTAIFVGGSIEIGSPLTFALDPGSTLDVFVAGTVFATSAFRVGSPAYPAQSRFYVGGVCGAEGASCAGDGECCSLDCGGGGTCSGGGGATPFSVNLTSNTDLAGLFYSPNGLFVTSSDLEMYGAIFAGSYHSSSQSLIHFDRAAASTDEECPGPEPMDGGVPADAGPGSCTTGAQPCGPGLPACGGGEHCIADCCVFFG